MNTFTITANMERYGKLVINKFPLVIMCPNTTLEKAQALAEALSNYYAGCDYAYYVLEDIEGRS